MKRLLTAFLLLFLILCAFLFTDNNKSIISFSSGSSTETEKYEVAMMRAFMDTVNSKLGTSDSDFTHLECRYTGDYTNADGQLCHSYYLCANYGEHSKHTVVARGYHVPELGRTAFFPYISLDNKCMHFDEEKEAMLQGNGLSAAQQSFAG